MSTNPSEPTTGPSPPSPTDPGATPPPAARQLAPRLERRAARRRQDVADAAAVVSRAECLGGPAVSARFAPAWVAVEAAVGPVFARPGDADLSDLTTGIVAALEALGEAVRWHDGRPEVEALDGRSARHWVRTGDPAGLLDPARECPAGIAASLNRIDLPGVRAGLGDAASDAVDLVREAVTGDPAHLRTAVGAVLADPAGRGALGFLPLLARLIGRAPAAVTVTYHLHADGPRGWWWQACPVGVLTVRVGWLAAGVNHREWPTLFPDLDAPGYVRPVPVQPEPTADPTDTARVLAELAARDAVFAGPGGGFARLAADVRGLLAQHDIVVRDIAPPPDPGYTHAVRAADDRVRRLWGDARRLGLSNGSVSSLPAAPPPLAHLDQSADELARLRVWLETEHAAAVMAAGLSNAAAHHMPGLALGEGNTPPTTLSPAERPPHEPRHLDGVAPETLLPPRHPDGPHADGRTFWYDGDSVVLTAVPYRVAEYMWTRENVSYEELIAYVNQHREAEVTVGGTIPVWTNRVNTFLHPLGLPWRLAIDGTNRRVRRVPRD